MQYVAAGQGPWVNKEPSLMRLSWKIIFNKSADTYKWEKGFKVNGKYHIEGNFGWIISSNCYKATFIRKQRRAVDLLRWSGIDMEHTIWGKWHVLSAGDFSPTRMSGKPLPDTRKYFQ